MSSTSEEVTSKQMGGFWRAVLEWEYVAYFPSKWKESKVDAVMILVIFLLWPLVFYPALIGPEIERLLHFTSSDVLRNGIGEVISSFIVWFILYHILLKFFDLRWHVEHRAKLGQAYNEGLSYLVEYAVHNSLIEQLYSSVVLTKLHPRHFPQSLSGYSFHFVRAETDFIPLETAQSMREQLVNQQIPDFEKILDNVKKSWFTIAYGDTSALIRRPDYIRKNIKMVKSKIQVKRIFIFPYWNDDSPYNATSEFGSFRTILKSVSINQADMNDIIKLDGGIPQINETELGIKLDQKYTAVTYKDLIQRAFMDAISLVWLDSIHNAFGIEHRILSRERTLKLNSTDIVCDVLLRGDPAPGREGCWMEEGSALIDNKVIVRFDDRMRTHGYIKYDFTPVISEVEAYNQAFVLVWGPELPISLTIQQILHAYFSQDTAAVLLDTARHGWVDLLRNTLN